MSEWIFEFVKTMQDIDTIASKEAIFEKTIKEYKSGIDLSQVWIGTKVYAIITATDVFKNDATEISCKSCKPLSNYPYNVPQDSICVHCFDFDCLGEVPISHQLRINGVYGFVVDIPMPERILLKYFDEQQLEKLKFLRKRFPKESYKIEFLQMLKVDNDNENYDDSSQEDT